jgi:GDP-4-dehydro-6-deoxy-D-mannose reductase
VWLKMGYNDCMQKVLVTGVNGFVGKHLARELKNRNLQVTGLGQHKQAHPEIAEFIDNYLDCDLTDISSVSRLPLENFDAVIGLAGLAKVGDSFGQAEKYNKVNVEVFSVLASELFKRNLNIRFITISTGAVYDSNQTMPLTEDSKLVTNSSPYAQSKILMEESAKKLCNQGLDCIIVRQFNHIGPDQEP